MPKPPAFKHRSPCPIAGTLDLLGDRWTVLVLRDLVMGKTRFREFAASPEGIASNILSQRLVWLTEHGFVVQQPDHQDGRGVVYKLTERGESLRPVLRALKDWGLANIAGSRILPDAPAQRAPAK